MTVSVGDGMSPVAPDRPLQVVMCLVPDPLALLELMVDGVPSDGSPDQGNSGDW